MLLNLMNLHANYWKIFSPQVGEYGYESTVCKSGVE